MSHYNFTDEEQRTLVELVECICPEDVMGTKVYCGPKKGWQYASVVLREMTAMFVGKRVEGWSLRPDPDELGG